jgi:hypothetical protein
MIRVTPLKFEVTALPEDFKEGALGRLTAMDALERLG